MPSLRLVKLTDADITLVGAPPGLTQIAADTLGNDLTDADGFDAILQGIAAAVSNDFNWVQTWDTLIVGMDFPDGQIVSSLINPLISDFALFLSSGDAQVADLDATLSGQSTSAPPPATPPTSTAPVVTAPVKGPPPAFGGGGGSQDPGSTVYYDPGSGEVYGGPDGGPDGVIPVHIK